MRGIALSLAGIVLVLFASACQESGNGSIVYSPNEIEYSCIPGLQPEIASPGFTVFRDQEHWRSFWAENWLDRWGEFRPPDVDFGSDMVVGIFWGLESQIGMDLMLRVASVARNDDITAINLREQPPGESLPAEGYADLFLKFERAEGSVMLIGAIPQ
jgi:hypothetical protein